MRGKIAFVLGAAVGYVLGTRAGRERYEQIKRGAQHLWQTEPVQRGVSAVRDAVDERAETVKVFVARVGADVLSGFVQPKGRPGESQGEAEQPAAAAAAPAEDADADAEPSASEPKAAPSRSGESKGSGAARRAKGGS